MEQEVKQLMQDFRTIYGWLSDTESKYIYLNRMNYLISGDKKYIDNIVTKYLPDLPIYERFNYQKISTPPPSDNKEIILYGAGAGGEVCLQWFKQNKNFVGFCDRNTEKQRRGFCGYKVMSPEKLFADHKDANIFVSSVDFDDEIVSYLKQNGVDENNIFRLGKYLNREISGVYFDMPFLTYEENEFFVDAGCYDLETTMLLKERCPNLAKVYAFEPDETNYKNCLQKKQLYNLSQVELYNCGTWSEKGLLHFKANSTAASKIVSDGDSSVQVVAIDDVIGNDKVTFIKMDVEGAELQSLKGAKNTIITNKPKLAICIYHKPEDMITIPLYIKSLVNEYKLYVRHLGNAAWETVLYAV